MAPDQSQEVGNRIQRFKNIFPAVFYGTMSIYDFMSGG